MKIHCILLTALVLVAAVGCNDAQIASNNLSRAADNFEILRRVVFLNGITDTYLLSIEGLCSVADQSNQLEVTCKVGDTEYKEALPWAERQRHLLRRADRRRPGERLPLPRRVQTPDDHPGYRLSG